MEEGNFVKPRPKKSLLQPPSKKRKTVHKIMEINFDDTQRADYLTGFHKRKLARAKLAQEQAAKAAREERNVTRKQVCYFLQLYPCCQKNGLVVMGIS